MPAGMDALPRLGELEAAFVDLDDRDDRAYVDRPARAIAEARSRNARRP